ncbi:hypothetical protein P3342_005059 [Pyrenophora teres f. teres]|nr:hypothetical protein P3342_005059 [Pyrenophora teres f. teres]
MPKRVRAPNCTHVDMDRVFGHDLQCHVCGRSPSIGFLYECKQDRDVVTLLDLLSPQVDKIKSCKSSLRHELEAIGLSESVILTAEKGHYTDEQLEKLKDLKLELNEIILMMEEASQANDFVSKLTAMARTPYATDGTYNSVPTKKSLGCIFRACHTCRPYYRDRLYISFEGVVNAEFPPMTRDDIQRLPTKSAKIMSTIGTKTYTLPSSMTLDTMPSTIPTLTSFATSADAPYPPPSTASTSSSLTFKTTQTDIEEISAQRRPRRRFYKMGRRSSADIARDLSRTTALFTPQGLKTAVQGIFRPGRESSSEGSNITLPLARTGTVREDLGDESMGEFDLGALRRVRKQRSATNSATEPTRAASRTWVYTLLVLSIASLEATVLAPQTPSSPSTLSPPTRVARSRSTALPSRKKRLRLILRILWPLKSPWRRSLARMLRLGRLVAVAWMRRMKISGYRASWRKCEKEAKVTTGDWHANETRQGCGNSKRLHLG